MIFEIAGAVGIDPGGYTLRELVWMRDGREELEWQRAAWQMSLAANIARDSKKTKPFKPDDFNPLRMKKPAKMMVSFDQFRKMLVKGGVVK